MFKTLEELKARFPIGAVYRIAENGEMIHVYNDNDIKIIKEHYDKITKIKTDKYWCVTIINYRVEGYLFDGEYWSPAKQTWDGWEPIDEDEINLKEF